MSTFIHFRLMRWAVPCCSLILVFYVAQNWLGSRESGVTLEEFHQQIQQQQVASSPDNVEARLRGKAEAVLSVYGEEQPHAVVTVSMNSDWEDVEQFEPIIDSKTLESIQTVGESMDDGKKYRNTKSSENYMVGHTKTVTHRAGPRLERVSCLVQVSEKNAWRCREIEQAVAVALGMRLERGDTVMASVK